MNTNTEPLANGRGTDQYQPGIAVDYTGKVGICWYDRRLDPVNYQVDRFCGVSSDGGVTFSNLRKSSPSWAPIHGADNLTDRTYMGDYDGVASDFTQRLPGFIGAFQMMNTRGALQGNSIPVLTRTCSRLASDEDTTEAHPASVGGWVSHSCQQEASVKGT